MYDLMLEIGDLPDEEKYSIVNECNLFFSDHLALGLDEEAIVASLKTPKELADSYKNGMPFTLADVYSVYDGKFDGKVTVGSFLKFAALLPLAFVYVPVMFVVGLALFLISAALCVASVCLTVFSFMSAGLSAGFVATGIGGIFFTAAFFALSIIICRAAAIWVTFMPKFMGRVLKNKRKVGNNQ